MAENDIPAISVPDLVPELFPEEGQFSDEDIATDNPFKILDIKITRRHAYYVAQLSHQPLHEGTLPVGKQDFPPTCPSIPSDMPRQKRMLTTSLQQQCRPHLRMHSILGESISFL